MIAGVVRELRQQDLGPGQAAIVALGQSGFLLRLAGAIIVVDPYLSPDPQRLVPPDDSVAEAKGIDIIACTHEHRDHLDLPTIKLLLAGSPEATLVVPEPAVGKVVDAGMDRSRITPAQPDHRLRFGVIVIDPLASMHGLHVADAYSFGTELSEGLVRFLGYVFTAPGIVLYHAGDTVLYPGLVSQLRRFDIDVAMLPINGRDAAREERGLVGNLDPAEAVQLATTAGADVLVPMHYDMFAHNAGHPDEVVALSRSNGHRLTVAVLERGVPFVHHGKNHARSQET